MIFTPTAFFNTPSVSLPPVQDSTFTYYRVKSGIDVSIPEWTVRVTGSIAGGIDWFGWAIFCPNAQYSSPTHSARYPGLITSPVSTKATNGYTGSYGLQGFIMGYSSSSLFTDSFSLTGGGTGNAPWSINGQFYGGSYSAAYTSYVVRDKTRWITGSYAGIQYGNWGNQPYDNTCAAYSCSFDATDITKYIDCSTNTAVTSSVANNACARSYQFSGAGGSPGKLLITNYYTGSCGTY